MVVRILSSDLLICDVLLSIAQNAELVPLIEEYNQTHPEHPIAAGSKSPLTAEEFAQWQQVVGAHGKYVAGGSAANTLSTLKQLLGEAVQIHFIAAYGADAAGDVIAKSLARDGFHLLPQEAPFANVQTATSFVLVDARGERSIVGFGGTARQKILSAYAEKEPLEDYDVLFLPGSLWQKYGAEFAQRLYQSCIDKGKRLWLSLPTHSQSGRQYNDAVRALIPQAEVVLANADELKRLTGCERLEDALAALQTMLGVHMAFITDGGRGAVVVTKESLHHVPSDNVPVSNVKNTLGAGDAAFAGFLYGVIQKMPVEKSAKIAMTLAAENIRHDSARILDARRVLEQIDIE